MIYIWQKKLTKNHPFSFKIVTIIPSKSSLFKCGHILNEFDALFFKTPVLHNRSCSFCLSVQACGGGPQLQQENIIPCPCPVLCLKWEEKKKPNAELHFRTWSQTSCCWPRIQTGALGGRAHSASAALPGQGFLWCMCSSSLSCILLSSTPSISYVSPDIFSPKPDSTSEGGADPRSALCLPCPNTQCTLFYILWWTARQTVHKFQ